MKTDCSRCNAGLAELKAATDAHDQMVERTRDVLPRQLEKYMQRIDNAAMRVRQAKIAKAVHTDWHKEAANGKVGGIWDMMRSEKAKRDELSERSVNEGIRTAVARAIAQESE